MHTYYSVILNTETVRRILKGEQTALGQSTPRRRHRLGQQGDILWVKERWRYAASADGIDWNINLLTCNDVYYFADDEYTPGIVWRSAVTMPFSVSRLHLNIETIKSCSYSDLTNEELKRLGYISPLNWINLVYIEFSVNCLTEGINHEIKPISL